MNQNQKTSQKTLKEITEEIQAHQKAIVDLANMAGNLIMEKVRLSAGNVIPRKW